MDYKVLKKSKEIFELARGFVEGHLIIPSVLRKVENIPSVLRKVEKGECEERGASHSYRIGSILPLIGHFSFGIYPIAAYIGLFSYNKEIAMPILATQLTTNTLSGLYEWYRYKRSKDKTTSDGSTGLERKTEEVEIEQNKIKKSEHIDPWKANISEIESKRHGSENDGL